MKIKVTFSPEDGKEAAALVAALLRRYPGAKVRRDKSKAPKQALYMTIKGPGTRNKAGENA